MSDSFDSVYPDLLRTGLNKLGSLDARRELLALFSALEHLRRDLHTQSGPTGIVDIGRQYLVGLDLFQGLGFWLVNPKDFGFELARVAPDDHQARLADIVAREIKAGRFALAVRQGGPVFFQAGTPEVPVRGVLHSLALPHQVVGMFCGLLRQQLAPNQEIAFSLLSLLLGECADALASMNRTFALTNQIETLSGLLPVCSWCKRVRNDSGYWEQIEKFIATRSSVSVTHGVCPDCREKMLAGFAQTIN
jgi:hypothetical protein